MTTEELLNTLKLERETVPEPDNNMGDVNNFAFMGAKQSGLPGWNSDVPFSDVDFPEPKILLKENPVYLQLLFQLLFLFVVYLISI